MNVKICNLPENDDPDSFVTNKKLKEVESYFEENSKDFIVYKASHPLFQDCIFAIFKTLL